MTEHHEKNEPGRENESPSLSFDIGKIIACPVCHGSLTDELKCGHCGRQYSYEKGVYDLISLDLSGEQEYLYTGNQDELEEDFRSFLDMDWQRSLESYYSHWNEDSLCARRRQEERMGALIRTFSGVVCDLATGGGDLLERLLGSGGSFSIICTDINKLQLMVTRANKEKRFGKKNVCYIATDGRYLSLKDESVDLVTSYEGFGNIPDGDRVAKELHRILKPGGKIVIQGAFLEKGSKSHEIAAGIGLERGLIEEYLLADLENAGFKNVASTVVGEAVWAENPDDLLPVAGDRQRFSIVTAEK